MGGRKRIRQSEIVYFDNKKVLNFLTFLHYNLFEKIDTFLYRLLFIRCI